MPLLPGTYFDTTGFNGRNHVKPILVTMWLPKTQRYFYKIVKQNSAYSIATIMLCVCHPLFVICLTHSTLPKMNQHKSVITVTPISRSNIVLSVGISLHVAICGLVTYITKWKKKYLNTSQLVSNGGIWTG